jgi:hypothetical protein
MKWIKISLMIAMGLFIYNTLEAKKKSFETCLKESGITHNNLQLIDKQKFDDLIKNSKEEIILVPVFTNYCDGTSYLMRRIDTLEKEFAGKVNIILCSSAPYNELSDLDRVLKSYQIDTKPVYVIDRTKYKEKRLDDRFKGLKFREDICAPCKGMIIGVPFIMIFNKQGQVLEYGYDVKYMSYVRNYFKR